MNQTSKKPKRKHFTKEQKECILKKTEWKCAHCGRKLTLETATIDHLIPLHKGGLNDEYNLIALCNDCNQDKSNFLYHILDYCKHIKSKYVPLYNMYHKYAISQLNRKQLFDYHEYQYTMFPPQQKRLIANMAKRNKKDLNKVINRMGVKLSLSRAWESDATECFDFIQKIKDKQPLTKTIIIYDNEQQVLNDIRYGEVYMLSSPNHTICGLFAFRRIHDDTFQLPQLQNMIQSSGLHAGYLCTLAIIDAFAYDVFDDIMTDISSLLLKKRYIPMYFNILTYTFAAKDDCFTMPYTLDGHEGTLDWMPMSYLREMILPAVLENFCQTGIRIESEEIELVIDAIIKYRNEEELNNADELTQQLFTKYPQLKEQLEPQVCPLYDIGFVKDKVKQCIQEYYEEHGIEERQE